MTGTALVKPLNASFEYITSRLDFMIARVGECAWPLLGSSVKGPVIVQREGSLSGSGFRTVKQILMSVKSTEDIELGGNAHRSDGKIDQNLDFKISLKDETKPSITR